MLVKNVTAGEPITASWANALVNNVNQRQSANISTRGVEFTKAKGGMQFVNDPAWQIRITADRKITLNAGQIYVNGLLVKPKDSTQGESSYNQICSVTGWKDNCVKDYIEDDLPVFTIEIEMPYVVDESNISDVVATLKVAKAGEANNGSSNEGSDAEEDSDKRKISIQLNDVEEKEIKQLVSGTIWLNYNTVSFIAGDNIHLIQKVDEVTNVETLQIHNKHSFVAGDGITILEEEELPDDGAEDFVPKNIITISTTPLSFIGTDGITIEEGEEEISDENNPDTTKKVKTVTIGGGGGNYSFIGKDGITILEEEISETREDGTTKNVQQITIFDKTISLIAHDPFTLKITKETGKAHYEPQPEWEAWTLQTRKISLIQGDGIKVTQQKDENTFAITYEVEAKEFSFVCNDNLEILTSGDTGEFVEWTAKAKSARITAGGALEMTKFTENTDKTWNDVYNLTVPHVSVIAGDNVVVEKTVEYGCHFYKVSATGGMSEIEFDPLYFTVTDGTVSLNEATIEQIANEAAAEIGVTVTAEGLLEYTASGEIKPSTYTEEPLPIVTVMNVE